MMEICRFVLCLAILSQGVWSRRPFKSQQSPRETIKNYEVFTPAIKYGDQQASSFDLSIVTKTYNFTIRLAMNRQLLASTFTSKHFDSRGKEVITKGHPKCFYQGTVDGYPSWTVALSTCSGIRGSFGDMATKTSLFHIEPLGDNKNRTLDQPHVLFMEAEYENRTRTCGTSHDHNVKPEAIRKELHHLAEKSSTPLIVELVIVNDLAQYQKYGSDLQMTVNRAIDVTNGADSLYKAFGIRIVLVQVITWTSSNLISVVPDSGTTLANLQVYAPAVTIQHDVTMLLTGISLNSFVVGLAYVSGMCSSYSVNLVEDFGSLPAVASTTAHELGHLFSMQHDNINCSCAQPTGCIMSAVQGSVVPNQWSSCSVNSITKALSTTSLGSCLTNVPTTTVGVPKCGNGIVRETKRVTVGLPRSAQIHVAMLLHVSWLQEHSAMEEHVAATVVFSPMVPHVGHQMESVMWQRCALDAPPSVLWTQLAPDGTILWEWHWVLLAMVRVPQETANVKAFYGSAGGDGDSSCYNYNNTEEISMATVERDWIRTYAACIASPLSLLPSDGSITIWLVQNGTKCGTNQICLSSQCLPLTSLNTRACPMGSNGVVCSGNGVCTNRGNCSCKVGFTGSACGTVYTSAVCAAPTSSAITPASSTSSAIPAAATSSRPASTSLPISTRPNPTPGPASPSASRPASTSLPISTRPNSTPGPASPSASRPASTPLPISTRPNPTPGPASPSASRPASTSLPISTRPNPTPGPASPSASRPASTSLPISTRPNSTPGPASPSASRPASTSLPISTRPNSTPGPASRSASIPAATSSRPASTPLPISTRPKPTPGPASRSASIPAATSSRPASNPLPISTRPNSTPGPASPSASTVVTSFRILTSVTSTPVVTTIQADFHIPSTFQKAHIITRPCPSLLLSIS
eukprot:Em0021g192a